MRRETLSYLLQPSGEVVECVSVDEVEHEQDGRSFWVEAPYYRSKMLTPGLQVGEEMFSLDHYKYLESKVNEIKYCSRVKLFSGLRV